VDDKQAWERVLAAVEADARRAEALLHAPPEPIAPVQPDPLTGVPADWLLPTPSGDLPAVSEMPPIPPELRERIETLRDQIGELQAELTTALRELRQPPRMVLAGVAAEPPVYVDRRL
jgi:hypothetical protein